MKRMSVTQYAAARSISRQHTLRYLIGGKATHLPAVKSAQKIGNTWMLEVDEKKLSALTNG